jgi:ubiquinol-cytochrome c reductase iron-sulfur subunit
VAESDTTNPDRRDFLYIATGAVGAVAVGAMAVPLIDQMNASADLLAVAQIRVDISQVPLGQQITVLWRGKPVFIRHRTERDIQLARDVDWHTLRDPEPDSARVKEGHAEWLVMIGVCTHLGCVPLADAGNFEDGWFCPCHGSQYDSSGRIRSGPAPLNLVVPEYAFVNDTTLEIG